MRFTLLRFSLATASVAFFGLAAGNAQAQTALTVFNFNTVTTPATLLASSGGLRSSNITTNFVAANVTNFGGTTINAQGGDVAGQALALQNGTAGVNNGAFIQFGVSTVGFSSISVSYATQGTGTGFTSQELQYSLNGTTFTSFGTNTAIPASFAATAFDLTGITGLNNNASATFRIIFNGGATNSAAGNNRVDNLVVTGTSAVASAPEPGALALVGAVAPLGLMAISRRRLARKAA